MTCPGIPSSVPARLTEGQRKILLALADGASMAKHIRSFLWWVALPDGTGFSVRTGQADRLVMRGLLTRTAGRDHTSSCTATEAGLRSVGRGQVPLEHDEPRHPASHLGNREVEIMNMVHASGTVRHDSCLSFTLKDAGFIVERYIGETRSGEELSDFTLSTAGAEAMHRYTEAMAAWRELTGRASEPPRLG